MSEKFTPVAVVPIPVCLVLAEKKCALAAFVASARAVPASRPVKRSSKSESFRASKAAIRT